MVVGEQTMDRSHPASKSGFRRYAGMQVDDVLQDLGSRREGLGVDELREPPQRRAEPRPRRDELTAREHMHRARLNRRHLAEQLPVRPRVRQRRLM